MNPLSMTINYRTNSEIVVSVYQVDLDLASNATMKVHPRRAWILKIVKKRRKINYLIQWLNTFRSSTTIVNKMTILIYFKLKRRKKQQANDSFWHLTELFLNKSAVNCSYLILYINRDRNLLLEHSTCSLREIKRLISYVIDYVNSWWVNFVYNFIIEKTYAPCALLFVWC